MKHAPYLLVPIPKYPYGRVGPRKWQDWYQQVQKTTKLARALQQKGNTVHIALLSKYHPQHQPGEIHIYRQAFSEVAPELVITPYHQTEDTLGQVEKSFRLQEEMGAHLIFITAWLQYPRVRYLAHRRKAVHRGAFGIPQPVYVWVDLFAIVLYPIMDALHIARWLHRIVVRRRNLGKEFLFW